MLQLSSSCSPLQILIVRRRASCWAQGPSARLGAQPSAGVHMKALERGLMGLSPLVLFKPMLQLNSYLLRPFQP
jgi:hypothetical protein